MKNIACSLVIGLGLVCHSFGLANAAGADPETIVRQATAEIYRALDEQCETIQREPEHLYALVDSILMPHADLHRMSQWVLGKYWRDASDSQRREFIEQFRQLLIRTYSTAVQLASLEDISYLPTREGTRSDRTTVRTEINRPGNATVAVFYLVYQTGGDWFVYDIQVDGVSLVNNYRTTFAEEIRGKGFSGLIDSLQQKNRQPMSADTAEQIRARKAAACGHSKQ